MRYLIIIVAVILLNFRVDAQTSPPEKPHSEKIIELPGINKDQAFKNIASYIQSAPAEFYYINDAIKNRNRDWALGRAKIFDKDVKDPGIVSKQEEKDLITASAIFVYQAAKENPFDFVTVYGDIEIHLKDGKMKVDFVNMRYTNKTSFGYPPAFKDIYAQGRPQCDNAGYYEKMLKCESSPITVKNINEFVSKCINQIEANILKAALTTPATAKDNSNW
ncbi:MAG: hypothetical protein WC756_11980 [Taibaiella sp.]|jgi:hypothetical protein